MSVKAPSAAPLRTTSIALVSIAPAAVKLLAQIAKAHTSPELSL
jgi:hypothetical protein